MLCASTIPFSRIYNSRHSGVHSGNVIEKDIWVFKTQRKARYSDCEQRRNRCAFDQNKQKTYKKLKWYGIGLHYNPSY